MVYSKYRVIYDGIENATHNTLQQKAGHRSGKCPGFSPDELRVAFSIPSGSLFLVNHLVFKIYTLRQWRLVRGGRYGSADPEIYLKRTQFKTVHLYFFFKQVSSFISL
jgi:hypothetical protein